jgi:hypothetical protein
VQLRRVIVNAVVVAMCGGGGDDGPPAGEASYAAYNMFTGAPRFAIFKADAERDLCVRVVFIWAGGGGTVALEEALMAGDVSVTHSAADCAPGDGDTPPSLEPAGVPADSVTGTATVTQDGEQWTVSIDGVIAFPAGESWVPASEPVEAEEIEIVGGCC